MVLGFCPEFLDFIEIFGFSFALIFLEPLSLGNRLTSSYFYKDMFFSFHPRRTVQLLTAPISSPHCMNVAQFNSRFAQMTGTLQFSLSHGHATDETRWEVRTTGPPPLWLLVSRGTSSLQLRTTTILLNTVYTPFITKGSLWKKKNCSQHRIYF